MKVEKGPKDKKEDEGERKGMNAIKIHYICVQKCYEISYYI